MRSYDCTPVSCPKLPSTFQHPMWQAWDLSLDLCLSQLPAVLECEESYCHSPFFEEQLTAFEVWLDMGSDQRSPPEQLPIVLQVLLSQVHRLRALELLSRFLDLGPWAVNLALSVGIFPYMLKLLQSSARELRNLLVFIWAKILAVDYTCQADLVRDHGYKYFLQIMQDTSVQSDHRTLAAFAMAVIVKDYRPGQEVALQENLVSICLEQMNDSNVLLKLWVVICLARLWQRYDKARWCGVRDSAHEKLYNLLKHREPEVRAAAVHALGTFMNTDSERTEHATNIDQSVATMLVNVVSQDMSPLVRMELVNALQWVIMAFENSFLSVAMHDMKANMPVGNQEQVTQAPSVMNTLRRNLSRERIKYSITNSTFSPLAGGGGDSNAFDNSSQTDKEIPSTRLTRVSSSSSISSSSSSSLMSVSYGSFYMKLWQSLSSLETDPFPAVAWLAHTLLDYVRDQGRDSVMNKDWADRSKSASFFSLPPSPSNRMYMSVDSPPSSAGSSVDLNKLGARIRYNLHNRRTMPNMISENASDDDQKILTSTSFVDWCCKQFAEYNPHRTQCDTESTAHFEREWRYTRNHHFIQESKDEILRASQFKIENQIFSTRSSHQANIILFHPYESHFVIPAKDAFVVWDYNNNQKLRQWSVEKNSWNRATHRITSLDFINEHDNTMLLVGSEDGSVRVWSNYANNVPNRDPTLVTAWTALAEISGLSRNSYSTAGGNVGGLRLAWDQRCQTLFAAGDARIIRLWDIEAELKLSDVSTGSDSFVNSICVDNDGGGNIFIAGFGDGTIRIFDRRLPSNTSKIITYREHSGCIVNSKIRQSSELVAGCTNGEVRKYDIRLKDSSLICRTSTRMAAFDVHHTADIFACGGVNHLTAYDIKGNILNCVRNNDWFMNPKIPSTVSYAAFHPNRVMLGYSLHDCSIVVSSLDAKKWRTNVIV